MTAIPMTGRASIGGKFRRSRMGLQGIKALTMVSGNIEERDAPR